MTPLQKRGFLMKKKSIQICFYIALILVCIIVFLCWKNNMQANFLSLWTALQKDSTFSLQNHKTDNVYILQTKKSTACVYLYRKQADGSLLRYILSEDSITKDITKNGQWNQYTSLSLPTSPYLLAEECDALLKGKSNATNIIKQYADLLVSSFSTVYNDSSFLIDYSILPTAMEEIGSFLKKHETIKKLEIDKDFSAAKVVSTFSPFADPATTQQVIKILSVAVQPNFRETICASLMNSCSTMNEYRIQITTSCVGNFISLEIFNKQDCMFTIKKLK